MKNLLPIPALLLVAACAQPEPIIDHDAPLPKFAPVAAERPAPRPSFDLSAGGDCSDVAWKDCRDAPQVSERPEPRPDPRPEPETDPEPQNPQECRPGRPRGRV